MFITFTFLLRCFIFLLNTGGMSRELKHSNKTLQQQQQNSGAMLFNDRDETRRVAYRPTIRKATQTLHAPQIIPPNQHRQRAYMHSEDHTESTSKI